MRLNYEMLEDYLSFIITIIGSFTKAVISSKMHMFLSYVPYEDGSIYVNINSNQIHHNSTKLNTLSAESS